MADAAAAATPTDTGGASSAGSGTESQAAPVVQDSKTGETTSPGGEQKAAEQKPAEPKTYKRKINGREESIPADAIDAAAKALGIDAQDLLNGSQLKKAAYEKFEAARKEAERVEKLKASKDPRAIARELLGMDEAAYRKHAEDFLLAELQREQQMAALTPEQQKYESQRQEFERQRQEFERQQSEAKEAQLAAQVTEVRGKLEPMILGAIEKAGLPRTPAAVRAVVDELQAQQRYGLPLDVDAAVRDSQRGLVEPVAQMLGKMPPERLVQLLGKEAYDGLLRYSISQKGEPQRPQTQQPAAAKEKGRSWMTEQEWREKYG
jgi:hypothetical protein